jgi:hypothetical protein
VDQRWQLRCRGTIDSPGEGKSDQIEDSIDCSFVTMERWICRMKERDVSLADCGFVSDSLMVSRGHWRNGIGRPTTHTQISARVHRRRHTSCFVYKHDLEHWRDSLVRS